MSNYGSNTFVIEGANGTEICNKIMKTFDICVELDTRYKIGEVNGKVYTIEKSKTEYAYPDGMEYVFSVWDKDDNDLKFQLKLGNDTKVIMLKMWRKNSLKMLYEYVKMSLGMDIDIQPVL